MHSVLILDGDISFIIRLRKALETQGFEVKTARRPQTAYEEIAAQTYHIAVVDIDFENFTTILKHLQASHPQLPIILSGHSEEDAIQVNRTKTQAYINKPYIARDLITIIEWTLAKVSHTDHISEQGNANEDWLDRASLIEEPPIDESATIGDMMAALLQNPDHDLLIGENPPDSLPESTAQLVQNLWINEPPILPEDSVASRVLRLSNDDAQLANLLHLKPPAFTILPLPSWQTPPTADEQAKILTLLGEIPHMILPPPTNASAAMTQPLGLPEIDLIPEDPTPMPDRVQRVDRLNLDLLDALAEAEHAEDTRLQAALQNINTISTDPITLLEPAQERLVATTVQEITQSMGIVLDDVEDESDNSLLPTEDEAEATLVAQAALQLTQLSLESAAIGTLLTYDGRIIANIGDISKSVWQDVAAQINAAWRQSDGSNTRLVYRMLDRHGQVLMFSLKTADDLTLTLIFSANTPLKVIRRQAKRITEALANVEPDALSAELGTALAVLEEPPAAITTPSRPTDLKPPAELGTTVVVAETTPKPPRDDSSYAGYALVWLLQNQIIVVDDSFKTALEIWLKRIAEDELWEIVAVDIQEGWINLHIEAPAKILPSDIATTLMRQTEQAIYDAYATLRETASPIWSDSYSILTPGRLMHEREIERFVRYHTLADT